MNRTWIAVLVLAACACGGAAAPPPSDPAASTTPPSGATDPAAASASPSAPATTPAAPAGASAATAGAPSPAASATSAAPPITTKLTKAQFDDATQFVFGAYKKKPYEAVFKEMTTRFGPPPLKTPPLFGWYGADAAGKCFEFYVQKNNGEKWAGTGLLETDAANCSK